MLIANVRTQLAGIPRGGKLFIACSGGPDSTALAFSVAQARPDLQLFVGHVRHGLRKDDWQDAQYTKVIAERIHALYLQTNLHMNDVAHNGNGPEDAARQARWNALATMASNVDCNLIAVGHTADDQAETVLLRLARGTGPEGLAGMIPRLERCINGYAVTIIRPMLYERRDLVHAFAYEQGVQIAQDPTNNDPVQRRARARHTVLPAMAMLRPDERDAVDAIVRLAQVQREQSDLLAAYLAKVPLFQWGNAVLIPDNSHVALDLPAHCLDAFYAGLLRRAIPMIGTYPQPDRARIDTIVGMNIGGRLDLPYGRVATRDKFGWLLTGHVSFETAQRCEANPHAASPIRSIQIIAKTSGVIAPCTIKSVGHPISRVMPPLPWTIPLSSALRPAEISIRTRNEADRSLRKVFQRFPTGLREHLPVVEQGNTVVAVGPVLM